VLGNDPFLENSLAALHDLQMRRNRMSFPATDVNPGVSQVDSVIQLNRMNLLVYLRNERKALQENNVNIDEQVGSYKSLIRTLPASQRDLMAIQRKLQVNEKLYNFLLEKRANTVIARAGIVPQTKVIERARIVGLVRPDKVKILYTFIVAGVVLSLMLVFVRVMFYDRIENADQLREVTNLPIFGEIIASEKAEENYVVVDSDPKSAITESFRTVRTNLEYLPASSGGKVVLITSYRPSEGKTFCSVNLAAILSKAGKRVLLLELDMHKPKVSSGLNMTSPVGMSNLLVGRASIDEVILPTQYENFWVILSGPTPPNASELVLSEHMQRLFEEGRKRFDYVLIDTPPVGLITDALVMMKHVDATLFVINTRFASKDHVKNAMEAHAASTVRNFGFILNGVRMKRSKYYYNTNYGYGYRYAYGYGSGYGYGYGYGYGRKRRSSNGAARVKQGANQSDRN
jgi:capsular exopolysaccharide synthesis family protein